MECKESLEICFITETFCILAVGVGSHDRECNESFMKINHLTSTHPLNRSCICQQLEQVKDKFVSAHAIKAHKGEQGTAPHIHKFGIAWKWLTSGPTRFASERGTQNLTNRSSMGSIFRVQTINFPCRDSNPDLSARSRTLIENPCIK